MSSEAALPRRIVKETQRLLSEPAPGISATPYRDNLRYFNIIIAGPTGSPYESGIFKLELFLPEQYPMESPKVRFLTKIYHPNINLQGNVCLNILREDWKPVLDINAVIYGLIYLFYEPNPDDPLNHEAAEQYRSDLRQFEAYVQRSLKGYSVNGESFERLL